MNAFALPPLIEPLFKSAGWNPDGRRIALKSDSNSGAQKIAAEILSEFAALQVGECGPGTEQAASDIHFYSRLRPEVSKVLSPWKNQIGQCFAFATGHHDHMILFVDSLGAVLVFTDPDSRLYRLTGTFGDAMRTILWGYSYGTALRPDA